MNKKRTLLVLIIAAVFILQGAGPFKIELKETYNKDPLVDIKVLIGKGSSILPAIQESAEPTSATPTPVKPKPTPAKPKEVIAIKVTGTVITVNNSEKNPSQVEKQIIDYAAKDPVDKKDTKILLDISYGSYRTSIWLLELMEKNGITPEVTQ